MSVKSFKKHRFFPLPTLRFLGNKDAESEGSRPNLLLTCEGAADNLGVLLCQP